MRGEDPPVPGLRYPPTPSPPHARGRPVLLRLCESNCRITPACAGKTKKSPKKDSKSPDHPRMRGEDTIGTFGALSHTGSPPHARGRPWKHEGRFERARITPACAGKTPARRPTSGLSGDHPRMRGEDASPTTWGRAERRITPACAGKTPYTRRREHDRPGSPPHARGRPHQLRQFVARSRITPACAGKTRVWRTGGV
mgnify:CR=1 FL=1